jgi:hypothetical protein
LTERPLQNAVVKKDERVERLLLGAGGNIFSYGEMDTNAYFDSISQELQSLQNRPDGQNGKSP